MKITVHSIYIPSIFTLIFLLFFIISSDINGQRRFNGEILLGLNAAQINGDNYAGYDHFGLMAGVGVTMHYNKKIDFCLDLLYDRRGSSSSISFHPKLGKTPFFFINLDYVSFPLYIKIKDWLVEYQKDEFNYYKFEFIGGLSFGKAFNISHQEGFSQPKLYNENDLSFLVGVTYRFNKHLGLGYRYTRSIIPVFRFVDNRNRRLAVIPYHMSIFTSYLF